MTHAKFAEPRLSAVQSDMCLDQTAHLGSYDGIVPIRKPEVHEPFQEEIAIESALRWIETGA